MESRLALVADYVRAALQNPALRDSPQEKTKQLVSEMHKLVSLVRQDLESKRHRGEQTGPEYVEFGPTLPPVQTSSPAAMQLAEGMRLAEEEEEATETPESSVVTSSVPAYTLKIESMPELIGTVGFLLSESGSIPKLLDVLKDAGFVESRDGNTYAISKALQNQTKTENLPVIQKAVRDIFDYAYTNTPNKALFLQNYAKANATWMQVLKQYLTSLPGVPGFLRAGAVYDYLPENLRKTVNAAVAALYQGAGKPAPPSVVQNEPAAAATVPEGMAPETPVAAPVVFETPDAPPMVKTPIESSPIKTALLMRAQRQAITSLEKQFADLQAKHNSVTDRLKEIEPLQLQCDAKLRESNANEAALQSRVQSLQTEYNDKLREISEKKKTLKAQILSLQTDLVQQKQYLREGRKIADSLREKALADTLRIEELLQKEHALTEKLEKAKSKLRLANQTSQIHEQRKLQLESVVQQLTTQRRSLEGQLQTLQLRVTELQSNLAEQTSLRETCDLERSRLTKLTDELRDQQMDLFKQEQVASENVKKLQNELENEKMWFTELSSKSQRLEAEKVMNEYDLKQCRTNAASDKDAADARIRELKAAYERAEARAREEATETKQQCATDVANLQREKAFLIASYAKLKSRSKDPQVRTREAKLQQVIERAKRAEEQTASSYRLPQSDEPPLLYTVPVGQPAPPPGRPNQAAAPSERSPPPPPRNQPPALTPEVSSDLAQARNLLLQGVLERTALRKAREEGNQTPAPPPPPPASSPKNLFLADISQGRAKLRSTTPPNTKKTKDDTFGFNIKVLTKSATGDAPVEEPDPNGDWESSTSPGLLQALKELAEKEESHAENKPPPSKPKPKAPIKEEPALSEEALAAKKAKEEEEGEAWKRKNAESARLVQEAMRGRRSAFN